MQFEGRRERHEGKALAGVGRRGSVGVLGRHSQVCVVLTRATAVLFSGLVLASCGGGGSGGPAVIRVGAYGITKGTIDHWARAIERGATIGEFGQQKQGTARLQAAASLIAIDWLRGEAATRRLKPSDATVEHALAERREANGSAEFAQSLRTSGQNEADVKLEVEAELAANGLRQRAVRESALVSEAEIARYYNSHPDMFSTQEQRDVELIEGLPSSAAARSLVGRLGTGQAFSRRAIKERLMSNRDSPSNPKDIKDVGDAIFAARQGVPSRPMSLNHQWAVFVVRRIQHSHLVALAKVRGAIASRLAALHRSQALSRFASSYRARWTTRTSCAPGYVVAGCARYKGPVSADQGPFSGG